MSDQTEVRNIYQRINAIMQECDYLQKKEAQQGKGIKYDEVAAMIRPLLIKHGIVTVVRQLSWTVEGNQVGSGNQKVYTGNYEMDLVNIDNPDDKVTHSAYAQGMDGGDKAAGKSHTYAAKIMLVKGFMIETGEDEESRAEKLAPVTAEQLKQLKMLFDKLPEERQEGVLTFYDVGDLSEIGKSQYKEVLRNLTNAVKSL